jgi:hypothetical protein
MITVSIASAVVLAACIVGWFIVRHKESKLDRPVWTSDELASFPEVRNPALRRRVNDRLAADQGEATDG